MRHARHCRTNICSSLGLAHAVVQCNVQMRHCSSSGKLHGGLLPAVWPACPAIQFRAYGMHTPTTCCGCLKIMGSICKIASISVFSNHSQTRICVQHPT